MFIQGETDESFFEIYEPVRKPEVLMDDNINRAYFRESIRSNKARRTAIDPAFSYEDFKQASTSMIRSRTGSSASRLDTFA